MIAFHLPDAMIICLCHRVSDRTIADHAARGADFTDLQFATGLGTACGQCQGCARRLLEDGGAPAHPACRLHVQGPQEMHA